MNCRGTPYVALELICPPQHVRSGFQITYKGVQMQGWRWQGRAKALPGLRLTHVQINSRRFWYYVFYGSVSLGSPWAWAFRPPAPEALLVSSGADGRRGGQGGFILSLLQVLRPRYSIQKNEHVRLTSDIGTQVKRPKKRQVGLLLVLGPTDIDLK